MQLPTGVRLSHRQQSCLERSEGQPRGRKGKAWFEWANNQLHSSGLPIIPLPEEFKDIEDSQQQQQQQQQQHTSSKVHKSAAAAAGTSGKIPIAAAAARKPSLIDLLRPEKFKDTEGSQQQQQHVVNKAYKSSAVAGTSGKIMTATAAQQQPSLINLQVAPAPAETNTDNMSNGTFIVTGGTLYGPGINISLTGGTINGFFKTTNVNMAAAAAAAAGGGTPGMVNPQEKEQGNKNNATEDEDKEEDEDKDEGKDKDEDNDEDTDTANDEDKDEDTDDKKSKDEDDDEDSTKNEDSDDEAQKETKKMPSHAKSTPAKRTYVSGLGMKKPKLRKLN